MTSVHRARTEGALNVELSIAELIGIDVLLAGPYLLIGLVWSFFHPDGLQRIQTQLEQQLHLPAGGNYQLAALGEASVLWPVISVLPSPGCAH
jgi:hypothetical protein